MRMRHIIKANRNKTFNNSACGSSQRKVAFRWMVVAWNVASATSSSAFIVIIVYLEYLQNTPSNFELDGQVFGLPWKKQKLLRFELDPTLFRLQNEMIQAKANRDTNIQYLFIHIKESHRSMPRSIIRGSESYNLMHFLKILKLFSYDFGLYFWGNCWQ